MHVAVDDIFDVTEAVLVGFALPQSQKPVGSSPDIYVVDFGVLTHGKTAYVIGFRTRTNYEVSVDVSMLQYRFGFFTVHRMVPTNFQKF